MSNIVVLDAGPLGLVTYPSRKQRYVDCSLWLEGLLQRGIDVRIPEIADYEVRRGYVRVDELMGIHRLNALQASLLYIPLTTSDMRRAASLWGQLRKNGLATAGDEALDGDVILASQVVGLMEEGHTVRVATTNKKHLERLIDAEVWHELA